jgi:hypothetical protein
MSPQDLTTLDPNTLATISGGMRFDEGDRLSDNVEDRRTPAGKARDQKWFDENRDMFSPIGPARPRPPEPTLPEQRPLQVPR